MAILSEQTMCEVLYSQWFQEGKMVTKELVIPVQDSFCFDSFYLDGRKRVRIDLAVYEEDKDLITFVEVENGLWMQHPTIYLQFCDYLYLAAPYCDFSYRSEQVEWGKNKGIGIIEFCENKRAITTQTATFNPMHPKMKELVRSLIVRKCIKEKKKVGRE